MNEAVVFELLGAASPSVEILRPGTCGAIGYRDRVGRDAFAHLRNLGVLEPANPPDPGILRLEMPGMLLACRVGGDYDHGELGSLRGQRGGLLNDTV